MTEPTVSNQLTMRWVEVRDESGRTRLESRWHSPAQAVAPSDSPHAA
jgi:hypothetical protein